MSPQVLDSQADTSTSAAGAMSKKAPRRTVWPSDLRIRSTAAGDPTIEDWREACRTYRLLETYASTSVAPSAGPPDAPAALAELRRLSGLTWEQLAQVFGVTRRTVHFWASGRPLNARNEEHLRRLLAMLMRIDRGSADINRAILFTDRGGIIPIKLLEEHRYDEFLQRVGEGPGRRTVARKPLSREARKARKPQAPQELVEALQDRVHKDIGRGRAARTVRNRPRGPDQ